MLKQIVPLYHMRKDSKNRFGPKILFSCWYFLWTLIDYTRLLFVRKSVYPVFFLHLLSSVKDEWYISSGKFDADRNKLKLRAISKILQSFGVIIGTCHPERFNRTRLPTGLCRVNYFFFSNIFCHPVRISNNVPSNIYYYVAKPNREENFWSLKTT